MKSLLHFFLAYSMFLAACNAGDGLDSVEDVEDVIENGSLEFSMIHTRYKISTGQFEEMKSPETERNLADPISVGGKLYYIDGLDEEGEYVGTVEVYDPQTNSWEQLTDRPIPGFAFNHVIGKYICGIGGFQNRDTPIRKVVDCFNTETDAWSERTELPFESGGYAPVVYEDSVYILGGVDTSLNPVDSAWKYTPETDQWEQLASLPFGFALGGVVPFDGKIYLVGGRKQRLPENENEVAKSTDMLVYDIASNSWSSAPDMPNSRFLYAATEVEGNIAVVFGISENAPLLEYYSPAGNSWIAATDPEEPPEGGAYTMVENHDQLYLLSIITTDSEQNYQGGKLLQYDLASDTWTTVGQRSEEYQDALFRGVPIDDDSLHFIGTHTTLVY